MRLAALAVWSILSLSLEGFCPSAVVLRRPTRTILHAEDQPNVPNYGLYDVQEELLVRRGELEEELMSVQQGHEQSQLKANIPKRAGGGKGFGASSTTSKAALAHQAKSHMRVLTKEGVVRIDNVLTDEQADVLRGYVLDLRNDSQSHVDDGIAASKDLFAEVLLKTCRWDLKLPLGPPPVMQGLHHVLTQSAVGATIGGMLTDEAVLYELSCLISNPGSQRQVVHPDNPWISRTEPTLLTCFIALQDIQLDMGPTVWLPRTHNEATHAVFQDDFKAANEERSPKDELLRSTKSVLGTLKKGCCALYDSRVLHCGSANKSLDKTRALFYFSFRNPAVAYPGNPASIRDHIGQAKLTLADLSAALEADSKGKPSPTLDGLLE